MRVLVIGGTTFFGKRIVEQCLERGAQVTIYTRGQRPVFWEGVAHIRGDRRDHQAFIRDLSGHTFDAVIDNIAFQREDVDAAVAAFGGRTGRYALTSTGSVYPLARRTEDYRPIPERAADLALRGDSEYAEGKRACEQAALNQTVMPFTILRPPIVIGPEDPTRRVWFWIQRVADGGAVLVPLRSPAVVWRHGYSGDVARATVDAATHAAAAGQTYNLGMEEILGLDDFIRAIAEVLGRANPVVSVPERILEREAPWYEPPMAWRYVPDITRIAHDLGFRTTPLRDWLGETARWHLDAGLELSAGYDRRKEEIALARRIGPARQTP